MNRVVLALCHLIIGVVALGCETSPSTSGPTTSSGGTCQSTCEKSIALKCPDEPIKDVAKCTSTCEANVAKCNNQSVIDAYLGCAQNTPMVCGTTLKQASSPQCLAQGLTFAACQAGKLPGADAVSSSDLPPAAGADVVTGPVSPPPIPTAGAGEIVAVIRDGATDATLTCTTGTKDALVGLSTGPSGPPPAPKVPLFLLTCHDGGNAKENLKYVSLTAVGVAGPGTYAVPDPATETVASRASLIVGLIVNKNGVQMDEAFAGTLKLTSGSATAGSLIAGSFTATWAKGDKIVDGVQKTAAGPGALSLAFQWTAK